MSDLISRADAIEVLQQFAEDEKPTDEMSKQFQQYQRGRHLAFLQAVEEIKALPSADADKPCKTCGYYNLDCPKDCEYGRPSADAVPNGEWIRKEKEENDCDGYRSWYWYECSVCGARPPKDTWKNEWHSDYCPSCGAYMTHKESE